MTHELSNEKLTGKGWRAPSNFLSPRGIGLLLLGLTVLAALGFFNLRSVAKPGSKGSQAQGQQAVPITVATVTQKTVPVQLQAIGNVQAQSSVSVTPQVGGQITGVYFKKGQEVKKGQLLFTLDDRAELAAIQQAQGNLARDIASVQQARATLNKDLTQIRQAQANLLKDQAQQKFAQSEQTRYGDLLKQGAVSQEQSQQYAANSQAATATVQADQEAIANAQAAVRVDQAAIQNAEGVVTADEGVLRNAQVQLSYTKIYAPIDGRVGNLLVNQGNVVQANSTNPLLTIYQIHPIQVAFSVPEGNLPQIQKHMQGNKLTVDVTFANSNTPPIPGVLTSVNNTVDNTTGTIQLLGEFNNPQGKLWPGQYVNTTLKLTEQPNAIVVPSQAVQNGPNGQFVFTVKPDMTVANIPVTVSNSINGLDVVEKGLQPGERVVTDGQANLVPGSKVRIKSALDSAGRTGQGAGETRGQGEGIVN